MADRTVTAKLTGDISGLVRAMSEASAATKAAADKMSADMARAGGSADTAGQGMSKMKIAALSLASGLAPIGTVAAGLGVGLLGVGAAAAVGFGAFKLAIDGTTAQAKQLKATLQGVVTGWQQSVEQFAAPALTAGIGTLKTVLNDLTPAVQGASAGLQSMFGSFSQFFSSGPAKQFFTFIGTEANTVFKQLGPIIENVLGTFMHLLEGAAPLVKVVLGLLEQATGFLAKIDFNKILGPLVSKFQELAPIVGRFLESIMELAGGVLKAIGPIGTALFGVISSAVTAALPVLKSLAQIIGVIAPVVGKVASALATLLGAAFQAILPVVSAFLPVVKNLAGALGSALVNGIREVTPAVQAIGTVVSEAMKAFSGALGPAMTGIGKLIGDMEPLTFVFAAAGKVVDDLAPLFSQLARAVAGFVGPLAQALGSALSWKGTVEEGLVPALANLARTIGGSLVKVLEDLEPILPVLANLFANSITGAAQLFAGAINALTPLLRAFLPIVTALVPLVGYLGSVLNALPAPALGAAAVFLKFHGAITGIPTTIGKLVSGLGSAMSKVSDFASATAGAIPKVAQWASQLAQNVTSVIKFAVEHAAAAASFIAENVAMAASATAAFIAENAATLGIVAGLAALVAGIVFAATHWSEVWGEIKRVAEDAWNFLKTVFEDTTIVGLLLSHWDQIRSDAVTVWNDVIAFIRSIPAKILAVFEGAGSWLRDVGRHIIDGLKNGITDAVKGVVDAAKNIGHDVLNAFKGIFSIFSPSKVMHDIGAFIVQGLALGITDSAAGATAAMKGLANEMRTVPFTPPTVAGPSLTGGSTAPGAPGVPAPLGVPVPVGSASPVPVTGSATGRAAPVVNVYAQTSATPHQIADEVGWTLRTLPER